MSSEQQTAVPRVERPQPGEYWRSYQRNRNGVGPILREVRVLRIEPDRARKEFVAYYQSRPTMVPELQYMELGAFMGHFAAPYESVEDWDRRIR